MVNYSVNGKYFISYSAFVKQSHGLLGLPEQKERYSYNWAEKDGIEYDLNEPVRFNERRISLEMFFVGDTWDELSENFTLLMDEFKKSGRQRLIVEPFGYNPLVYDVILGSEVYLEKRFKEGRMFGVCTLNVIEPNPIKRVFMLVGGTLNLKYNSDGQTRVKIDGEEYVYFGNVDEGYSISERDILIKPSVDEIEIGGRNYIVESNKYHGNNEWYSYGYAWNFSFYVDLKGGETYTISIPVRNLDDSNNSVSRIIVSGSSSSTQTIPPLAERVAKYTFTYPEDEDQVLIRFLTNSSGIPVLEWGLPKLEKGNKATDWTPAPEDVHYVTIEGNINLLQTNADEVI